MQTASAQKKKNNEFNIKDRRVVVSLLGTHTSQRILISREISLVKSRIAAKIIPLEMAWV